MLCHQEVTTPKQARARPSWKCRELFRCHTFPCGQSPPGRSLGGLWAFRISFDAVTDTEVGAVHMTSDDEDHRDRQMVMGNIRQPQETRSGDGIRPGRLRWQSPDPVAVPNTWLPCQGFGHTRPSFR
jgi:hypothetical protein